jgi:glycolate oxidase FAD binding subunit
VTNHDLTDEIIEAVQAAAGGAGPLRICGGDSKPFYGREIGGKVLSLSGHRGIVNYDPAELVLTARAGTPLDEIEQLLAAQGQRLPFEPPHFGPRATLGGAIAAGLSGPARCFAGTVRDHLLGVRIIDGRGRQLRFGGQVMKNVAGYDVARLMAGALGTLGVLTEVSVRVQPAPVAGRTLVIEADPSRALDLLNELCATSAPLSASCWTVDRLALRLEGTPATLRDVSRRVTGHEHPDAEAFWLGIREQTHVFFEANANLCRIIVPAMTPWLPIEAEPLIEWNGMQRWYQDVDFRRAQEVAAAHGGFATLFRSAVSDGEVFAPLPPAMLQYHQALKRIFDPDGIINPGRMYPDL